MTEIDQKRIFSKNLNYFLSKYNKTQKEVADAISVSPQTFNTWCKGIALPRMGKVQRLADYFHIEKSDLIDERLPTSTDDSSLSGKKQRSKGVVINIYGRVAAGIPIEMIEDIVDTEEISEDMAKTGEYFGLIIKGNSMLPNICDGDIVIIRCQEDAENGDTVIATVNGNDATCKRLRKYKDGIELISNNPSYDPMYFSNQDVAEKPVKILGKVVELRRKL